MGFSTSQNLIYLDTTYKNPNWFLGSIHCSSSAAPEQTHRLRPQTATIPTRCQLCHSFCLYPPPKPRWWNFFLVSSDLQFSIATIFVQFYPRSSTAMQMSKERFSISVSRAQTRKTKPKQTKNPHFLKVYLLEKNSLPSNYKESMETILCLECNSEATTIIHPHLKCSVQFLGARSRSPWFFGRPSVRKECKKTTTVKFRARMLETWKLTKLRDTVFNIRMKASIKLLR